MNKVNQVLEQAQQQLHHPVNGPTVAYEVTITRELVNKIVAENNAIEEIMSSFLQEASKLHHFREQAL